MFNCKSDPNILDHNNTINIPIIIMVLKVYVDLMSQPCRALVLFLRLNKVPYEECAIAIRKGEHMTEEYEKINPFKKVPAIDHDGFKLTETVAIMRYLCTQYRIPDHWYPADPKLRARVDEFMAWQHMNVRFYGSMLFLGRVMAGKQTPNAMYVNGLEKCLDQLSSIWLMESPYLNGFHEITFADLMCVTELEQAIAGGQADLINQYPKVTGHLQRVRERVGSKLYDDTSKYIFILRDKVAQGKM